MSEITEGTELYVPNERYREARTVTVTKVGRKWLTLSDYSRADRKTLHIESSCGPAHGTKLYRSKEEWESDIEHQRLWWAFRKQVEGFYSTPPASPGAIHRAAAELGLTLTAVEREKV